MAGSSEGAAKRRGAGKPFQKGQSGNPSGRRKRTPEELDLIAACREKSPKALDVIEDIMLNGEMERNRLAAAQTIIERAWGKPMQPTELTGKDGGPIEMRSKPVELTDEELERIAAGRSR